MLPSDKSIIVAPRFQNQTGDKNIPVDSGSFSKSSIEQFPDLLATYLAEKIRILIGHKILKEHGFYSGDIDGQKGSKTDEALREFQKAKGLPITARFDKTTISGLIR